MYKYSLDYGKTWIEFWRGESNPTRNDNQCAAQLWEILKGHKDRPIQLDYFIWGDPDPIIEITYSTQTDDVCDSNLIMQVIKKGFLTTIIINLEDYLDVTDDGGETYYTPAIPELIKRIQLALDYLGHEGQNLRNLLV